MEKFRTNLIQVINTAQLPIGEAYYVLKDVFRDVQDAYKESLREQERLEKEAAMQATSEDSGEVVTEDELK